MRFFLVARETDTGTVRLITDVTYARRQDALDVLGPAVDGDPSLETDDLFLVDLDQITPVVLYRAATPAAPSEEPIADAWMAPAEADVEPAEADVEVEEADVEPAEVLTPGEEVVALAVTEEAVLEGPEPLWVPDEPPAPVESSGSDLADALRRAASRMESEGIVAPPDVEEFAAQTVPETLIVESTVDVALEVPSEAPAEDAPAEALVEAPAVDAASSEVVPGDPAALWPWESAGAEDEAEASAAATEDPEAAPIFEPVGIDEPGLEEVQLLTPVEDVTPRPLIIGEYAEVSAADPDDLTLAELEALAGATDVVTGVEDAPSDGTIAIAPSAPVDEKAYEPGGLDIAAYTCDDCVYVVTCPKARQEGPATCGSFQWKSV
jgi:hypothetical protein